MKNKLIIIAGATATGKTKTAVALAKKLNTEIISADSMQIYKYMDIGTAKPTSEEMQSIPHHCIDEIYPDDEFNIAVFKSMAKSHIEKLHSKSKIPIIVGGTGFYINSLIYDNDFVETKADEALRKKYFSIAEQKGNEHVHSILKNIDPLSAEKIHPNNIKKVIRAIEFFEQTGQTIYSHNEAEKNKVSPYDAKIFILNMPREILYKKIEMRVNIMIQCGLVEEVKKLLDMGYSKELTSMQGIGYKEIIKHLDGAISLDESIELIKKNTRHYAKRQITWFKGQTNGKWFDVCEHNYETIINEIINSQQH